MFRGQTSNWRLRESLRKKALKPVQSNYRDFGPTLACESGEARRCEDEQGDAAAVADHGRVASGEVAQGGGGARLASTAELPRRALAMGHFGARLAARSGTKGLSGGHDRRRYQPSLRTLREP